MLVVVIWDRGPRAAPRVNPCRAMHYTLLACSYKNPIYMNQTFRHITALLATLVLFPLLLLFHASLDGHHLIFKTTTTTTSLTTIVIVVTTYFHPNYRHVFRTAGLNANAVQLSRRYDISPLFHIRTTPDTNHLFVLSL